MAKQDALIAFNGHNEPQEANPFLWSSHNWMVREAGRIMAKSGYDGPTKVSCRGYKVNYSIYDRTFIIHFKGDDLKPEIKETSKLAA